MNVDWSKPIQTRGGRKARLLGELKTSSAETENRVVAVEGAGGDEGVYPYFENGSYLLHEKDHRDIINVPPRKETREVVAWAVTNKAGGVWSVLLTEAAARHSASHCCATEESHVIRLTGTVEVEVEE